MKMKIKCEKDLTTGKTIGIIFVFPLFVFFVWHLYKAIDLVDVLKYGILSYLFGTVSYDLTKCEIEI